MWVRHMRRSIGDKEGPVWEGPYKIHKVIGLDLYQVEVPHVSSGTPQIQEVSVDCLKLYPFIEGKAITLGYSQQKKREKHIADTLPDYQVEKILKHRGCAKKGFEFLVRWEGYTRNWDTWEPAEQFLPQVNHAWKSYISKHKIPVHLGEATSKARKF